MLNSPKKRKRMLSLLLSLAIVFSTFGGAAVGYADVVEPDLTAVIPAGDPAPLEEPAPEEPAVLDELVIASVEELTRGDMQILYRDEIYQGVAENGEDPEKYYTTYREINLKDPRIFNFEFTVPADAVEDEAAFLESVSLQYGGLDLEEWVWDGFKSRFAPIRDSVLELKDKSLVLNEDGSYTVKIAMETKLTWTGSAQNAVNNIPYDNYGAGRQFDFGNGQSSDNRAWWQAGPLGTGVGTYTMTATVGGEAVAAVDLHIAPYDGMYSWIEINEYAQSLIKAINGEEYPKENLDGHTIGLVAAGYVGMDEDGNFVAGNADENVYVEVSILGYGLTDNYKEENLQYNNYSQFNAIWNIAVAMDEETVDTYLNETVPAMNTDPQALIDEIKDKADEDIDLMQVFYQNNVHSDEVTGTDVMIKMVTDMIEGGKAGKDIAYKSWDLEDMDLYYRDYAEGAAYGEAGHVVKGGYSEDGLFMQEGARNEKVFNTKEALENFIFVSTLCSNPDGKAGMRRTNRYDFDLNRDAVFSTMPETIAIIKDLMKWDPLVMNEWHGYVTQMLIEPCTAPHDPAYDYDLMQNNMLNLSYAAGLAATGSSGMQRFLVPWDHYDGGDWDDGGTIYAPMYAMLLGTYGFTIEFPYSNLDSMDANEVINYAMVEELLRGETEFFPGNRLNGELEDEEGNVYASHEEDIQYTSMRKSSLISKLTVKARGLENVDAKETVDKYFIDKKNDGTGKMVDKVVGRARPVDAAGNELSFFPDYIVVPTDDENQYNVAEGIKIINQLLGWGIKVSVSTEAVEYDGKEIPAGAYVLDMKQSYRNVIFETMSKGYDATGFASMYADIYCNLPDVRGFDSIQIYGEGLYDGKLETVASVEKTTNITGAESEYIVFKSQSTDAVRFVNLLLSGYSSGPSYSAKGDVWMLREAVEGVGNASDYIIKASDLSKINLLQDNPVINLIGCHIEGQYITELPAEAVKLVEPVIQFNTTRTAQSGGPLWYMMDEYLGFKSMTNYDGSTSLRYGANVIIANNQRSLGADIVNAVKSGTGIIFIRNASALSSFGITAPSTGSFVDVAINGQYNVDNSLFTENYAKTTTYYARGYKYNNVPEGAKILFHSAPTGEEAFIGGFQNTKGVKDTFADATTMFSIILENEGAAPAQALVIGQQMDNRAHYQKLLPMLATAIYANAAGILDDQNAPVIAAPAKEGDVWAVTAAEPDLGVVESGLKSLAVYNSAGELIAEGADGRAEFAAEEDMTVKVVAIDYAGNIAEAKYDVDFEEGTATEAEKTAAETVEELIAAIGAVTEESEEAIEEARAAYDALSEEEKAQVGNYATLLKLEAAEALDDVKNLTSENVAIKDEAALKEAQAAAEAALADAGYSASEAERVQAALDKINALVEKVDDLIWDETYRDEFTGPAAPTVPVVPVDPAPGADEESIIDQVDGVKLVARSAKAKLNGKNAIKVYWYDEEGADIEKIFEGYQVFRSTKRYSGYTKNPIFVTDRDAYWNSAIEAGTTYYYKVRGFVTVDGEKYYSEWSKKAWRTA